MGGNFAECYCEVNDALLKTGVIPRHTTVLALATCTTMMCEKSGCELDFVWKLQRVVLCYNIFGESLGMRDEG